MQTIKAFFPLFLLIALFALNSCSPPPAKVEEKTKLEEITLTRSDLLELKVSDYSKTLLIYGQLVPDKEAQVSAEVSGEITELNYEQGKYVPKGALLAKLKPSDLLSELTRAKSNRNREEAQLNLARLDLTRKTKAAAQGLIALSELDQAKANTRSAEEVYKGSSSEYDLRQSDLAKTKIIAPIGGYVQARPVKLGQFVRPGDPLYQLVQLDPIKAEFEVPTEAAANIIIGSRLTVEIEGQAPIESKVEAIEPIAAADTRTYKIYALIQNPESRLKANSFAKAQLVLTQGKERGVIIPANALNLADDGRQSVLVFNEANKRLIKKIVKATPLDPSALSYVIEEGLEAGQIILNAPNKKDAPELQTQILN